MVIIDKIISEIKHKNMSQKDFSEAIGIHPSVLSDWKSGKSNSYMKQIDKIAEYLNVSADELLGTEKPAAEADRELQEYLEELRTRPELKMLFSLTKKATKADVEQAVKIIEALRNK